MKLKLKTLMKILKYLCFTFQIISSLAFYSCEKQEVNEQPVSLLQESMLENASFKTEAVKEKEDKPELPILFSLNGLYGYLGRQLQVLVPPIYDRGFNYTDHGYTWVRFQEQKNHFECLILGHEGEILFRDYTAVIYILYDDIISYTPENERYSKIVKFRDNNIVANATGVAASKINENIIILVNFTPGIERGFVDSYGNRILPDLELKRMSRGFKEDRAVVVLGQYWDIRIIDIYGNMYGNLEFYRTGRDFSEGLLPAETTDGLTGYINKDGEFAFNVPIVADIPDYDESPLNATDFQGGYALIQTIFDPPTWRVINNQGLYVSDELSILWAEAFTDGLSCVRLNNNSYAYINAKGSFEFDVVFDKADSFHYGYARIVLQGRDGLINTKGEIFWCDEIVSKSIH